MKNFLCAFQPPSIYPIYGVMSAIILHVRAPNIIYKQVIHRYFMKTAKKCLTMRKNVAILLMSIGNDASRKQTRIKR